MIKNKRKNVAVILAGGTGHRSGLPFPKQFYKLRGHTLLEHAVTRFCAIDEIDEVAIVSHKDHISTVHALIAKHDWFKVTTVLIGGKERYDSSLVAVRHYEDSTVNILFHDVARPLVCPLVIKRICTALITHEAVATGLPSVDTIWQTKNNYIASIPNRTTLMRAQTPQAFRSEVIAKAYNHALSDPMFTTTDDCGVVSRYLPGIPIYIVEGAEQMMKLTYASDITILEHFLENEKTFE